MIKEYTTIDSILPLLQYGVSIPILPSLVKYIKHDMEYFNTKSICIEEEGKVIAHTLVFHPDNSEILYFGYFKAEEDDSKLIQLLIEQILNYFTSGNFKTIFGPINLPTPIFGWGFMQKDSDTKISVGNPINPPIYKEIFLEAGFKEKFVEVTWSSRIMNVDLALENFDISEFEVVIPKDRNDLQKLKNVILELHGRNLLESAQITPNVADLFDNYADFILEFGEPYMLLLIKHKPTGKFAASVTIIPNIYRKDSKGRIREMIYYSWVVDKEFRKKGLALLLFSETSMRAKKAGYKFWSAPIANDNVRNSALAKKYGAIPSRSHVILEYEE